MRNSGEKARKSKGKNKSEPFVWTNDEVELLLNGLWSIKLQGQRKMSVGNRAKRSILIF